MTSRKKRSGQRAGKNVHILEGELNIEKFIEDLITTGSGHPFYGAIRQLIENSIDSHSKAKLKISIMIAKWGRSDGYIIIQDNGTGMSHADAKSFFSVGLSSKRGKKGKIGQHGTGHYQVMSFADKFVVYTRSEDYPKTYRCEQTLDDVRKVIKTRKYLFEMKEVQTPTWLRAKGTFTTVILEGIDWDKVPKAKEIIERFSSFLSPTIADCIVVNDKALHARQVIGEVIRERIEVPYLPDVQIIDLYFPEIASEYDQVELGAHNPLCTLRNAVSRMNSNDRAMIPPALQDRSVSGVILIPALNEFRDSQSGNLTPEFFGREGKKLRDNILTFLNDKVSHLVQRVQEAQIEVKQEKDRTLLLEGIVSRINPGSDFDPEDVTGGTPEISTGNKPKGPKKPRPAPAGIQVSTRTIKLMSGDIYSFRVTQTIGTSGTFGWNGRKSGGTISPKSGPVVLYTAGDELSPEGEPYELVVWDKKNPDHRTVIQIFIVETLPVLISPQAIQIPQAGSHEFRLRNNEKTSSSIIWSVFKSPASIMLDRTVSLTTRVSVNRNAPLGTQTLVAEDTQTKERYRSTFEVVPAIKTMGAAIKMEKRYYFIRLVQRRLPDIAVVIQGNEEVEQPDGKKKYFDVIEVGMLHPIIKHTEKVAGRSKMAMEILTQTIIRYMVLAHLRELAKEGETLSDVNMTRRIIEIEEVILEGRVKSKD